MFKADPLMLVQESLARVNEIRKEFLICIELRIVMVSKVIELDRLDTRSMPCIESGHCRVEGVYCTVTIH